MPLMVQEQLEVSSPLDRQCSQSTVLTSADVMPVHTNVMPGHTYRQTSLSQAAGCRSHVPAMCDTAAKGTHQP